MANYIFGTAWLAPSNYYTSSAATGFPGSAAYDYRHPYRPWKGTAAMTITDAQEWVGYDLGGNFAPATCVIDNCNMGTVRIRGASNSAFTTGTVISADILLQQDMADGRYKVYFDQDADATIGGVQKQYWRVENVHTTTIDGAAMQVGSLNFFSSVDTWPENLGESYDEEFLQAVRPGDGLVGGGREPKVVGNPGARITIGGSYQNLSLKGSVFAVLRLSEGNPLMFYRNQGTASAVYIGFRTGPVVVRQPGPNHISVQHFTIEEVR